MATPVGAAPPPTATRDAPIRELFASRSYRSLFFSSATFSLGIWGYLTAMGWSARALTDSPFLVSLVTAIYFTPFFLVALPAGVLADRLDRRRLVLWSRGGSAALVTVMLVMSAMGALTYVWLALFSAGVGLSVIAELAARQSLVAQIVPTDRLIGASGLTSMQGGIARVFGPLLAGWLIARYSEAAGYAVFAVSQVAFVLIFRRIEVTSVVRRRGDGDPWADLRAGFTYLRGHRDALAIVLISILGGTVGWLYLALLPVMAVDVLDGGAVTLGWLSTAVGIGSLPVAIVLAVRGTVRAEGLLYVVAVLVWAAGIIGFGAAPGVGWAMGALLVAGVGFTLQTILSQTLLLRIVEPAYHGRVFGTLALTWGANVVGTLVGGTLAETLGARAVIIGSGVAILVSTLVVLGWNRQALRL